MDSNHTGEMIIGDQTRFAIQLNRDTGPLGLVCLILNGYMVGDYSEPFVLKSVHSSLSNVAEQMRSHIFPELNALNPDAALDKVLQGDGRYDACVFSSEGFDDFDLVFLYQQDETVGDRMRIVWRVVDSPSKPPTYKPGKAVECFVDPETFRRTVAQFGAALES